MRRRYAEGTTVPVERSRAELTRILQAAGATGFVNAWDTETGIDRVIFRMDGFMIRVEVSVPAVEDLRRTAGGQIRSPANAAKACDQEYRRRWRAQVLVTKAKLEIVDGGASTVQREFLADVLLPDGGTLGEEMIPRLEAAYESGTFSTDIPLLGSGEP